MVYSRQQELELTKIPGTTFAIRTVTSPKRDGYIVGLYRGVHEASSLTVSASESTQPEELLEIIGDAVRQLLEKEKVYLSTAVIDRTMKEVIEKLPSLALRGVGRIEPIKTVTPTAEISEPAPISEDIQENVRDMEKRISEIEKRLDLIVDAFITFGRALSEENK